MKKLYLMVLIPFLFSCNNHQPIENTGYHIAYKNDKEGNTLSGSKSQLIQAIRGGADIKIGWGGKGKSHSIEHLSEPIWIAVLDEKEVIAHLDPQLLSKIEWDNLSASYADSTILAEEWRVVINTNGEFDAIWIDRQSNELIKRRPQNHVITWFVKNEINDAKPLFDTVRY